MRLGARGSREEQAQKPGPPLAGPGARLKPGQKVHPPNSDYFLQTWLRSHRETSRRRRSPPSIRRGLGTLPARWTAGRRPQQPQVSPGKVASSPGYHLTSLASTKDLSTLVPPWHDSPGPRTSRKVSVFISLQGVSTMRAASRTPSVAFVKHWERETRGCHWDLGPGRKGCPSRSAPVGL